MQEDNQAIDPVVPTDTQEQVVAAPVDNGHADNVQDSNANPTPDNSASDDPQDQGTPEEIEKIRDARYAGKLKQIQEELEKERQARTAVEEKFSKISTWASSKPDTYKEAVINTLGFTPEQADQHIAELKAQGYWSEKNQAPVENVAQAPDISQEVEKVLARREEEKVKGEALTGLIETYGELAERSSTNSENVKKAFYVAEALRVAMPNLTFKEALLSSYAQITGKSHEETQKALENAKVEGMAMANGAKASSISSPMAQNVATNNTNLSQADREMASKLKMSESDYAKRKNERITVVDI